MPKPELKPLPSRHLAPHALARLYWRVIAGWQVFFKRYPDAIFSYRHCLALHPQDEAAQAALAHLYAQMQAPHGDAATALLIYADLHRQHPNNPKHRFNAGYLLQTQGQHSQACGVFQSALAIEPTLDRAWYGLALSQMALTQWADAADSLLHNTRLQPMSPYGWYQLAIAQAQQGLWDQAHATQAHLSTFEPAFGRGLQQDLTQIIGDTAAGSSEPASANHPARPHS